MATPYRRLVKRLRGALHARGARVWLAALNTGLERIARTSLDLGSKGSFKVRAQPIESEIQALAGLIAARKPRVVLEIDTGRGGTLLIWAQLARDLVVTCDLKQPEHRQALYARFAPPGSSCRIAALVGDSHSAAFLGHVLQELDAALVDFLFIDGDHILEGVTADYRDLRSARATRRDDRVSRHRRASSRADVARGRSVAGAAPPRECRRSSRTTARLAAGSAC